MLPILRRWQARWHLFRDSGERLKRRVEVEQYLLDCACGKRPLPDAGECKRLALRLGTTDRW